MNKGEASLLDFAKQYKFETKFNENSVEHTYTAGGEDVVMDGSDVNDQNTQLWMNIGQIGNGAYGSVWLQKETSSRKMRAVKKILRDRTPMRILSRELRSLIVVRDCEHIVRFFGWYENVDFYFIAMEYAEYGDLNQHLVNTATKPAIEHVKEITNQILKALVILHGKDICHRDLKPQNVLITSLQPIHIKLADFGISKSLEGTELRTMLGTPAFRAPEVLGILPQRFRSKGSNSYTNAVDIWALGCLVYNMLTLETPFLTPKSTESQESSISISVSGVGACCQRELDYDLLHQYCNGGNHAISSSLQRFAVAESEIAFVNRLLVVDPKSRISAAAALMDPWFMQGLYPRNNGSYDPKDHDGFLIEAARCGRADLIYTFLSAGYDVRRTDSMGDTALHHAAMSGHYDAVRLLLEWGADWRAVDKKGNTVLHRAASHREDTCLRHLLQLDASLISAVNLKGYTPLHIATFYGREGNICLLLEKGADWRVVDNEGNSVLHRAAWHRKDICVRRLLALDASLISAVNLKGSTPLHEAAFRGQEGNMDLFILSGADWRAVDKEGNTVLHRAASHREDICLRRLLELSASLISAVNSKGYTPLHIAAFYGREGNVRLLLEKGANWRAVDKLGGTPMSVARGPACKVFREYVEAR